MLTAKEGEGGISDRAQPQPKRGRRTDAAPGASLVLSQSHAWLGLVTCSYSGSEGVFLNHFSQST